MDTDFGPESAGWSCGGIKQRSRIAKNFARKSRLVHTFRVTALAKFLPLALPLIVRWAERAERRILAEGDPLSSMGLEDAVAMGVGRPKKIRLLRVDHVPLPGEPFLGWIASKTGLPFFSAAGMSLRYGIFVRREFWGDRHLIAHECVHTGQYERLGGFRPFLARYLEECLQHGYAAAPLEYEAMQRAGAIRSSRRNA